MKIQSTDAIEVPNYSSVYADLSGAQHPHSHPGKALYGLVDGQMD
jgi:hypothetical protein